MAAPAAVRLAGRRIPVELPRLGDPRLHLAAVILGLQVLGQVALEFRVSIAQILVTIGACAVVEVAVVFAGRRVLAWPASAMLTGNSVAFILRANGTHHGDWWALNGIGFFLAAGLIGLGSKHLLRIGGRHLFNPSNLGLVAVFLVAGAHHVYPQYLWWGSLGGGTIAAMLVILAGAFWVLRPLGMAGLVAAFLGVLTPLLGILAASGACFSARWSDVPVCGSAYVTSIALSPELLVFVFFMISDPRTVPPRGWGRFAFGAAVGVLGAALLALQPSEYGIKVALLAALTIACPAAALMALRSQVMALARRARAEILPGGDRAQAVAAAVGVAIILAVPVAVVVLASDSFTLGVDSPGTLVPTPGDTPLPNPQG